jgi:ribosomal protein S18 acetylase RimI-like enzyme
MEINEVTIEQYKNSDHNDLLFQLIELHTTYFRQNVSTLIQAITVEKDIKKNFEDYLEMTESNLGKNWMIYTAKTPAGRLAGFIIGSIQTDDKLVLNKIGRIEDWYVDAAYRRLGIGRNLYKTLEQYFIEHQCQQVQSETWSGFEQSITAHQQSDFFVSGISFSKIL